MCAQFGFSQKEMPRGDYKQEADWGETALREDGSEGCGAGLVSVQEEGQGGPVGGPQASAQS